MTVDLKGVIAKLNRADTHLADLKVELARWLNPDLQDFTIDRDDETGEHVYRIVTVPRLGTAWAVIAGDVLTNLRAALDHFAWQLVLFDGKQPGENTQFPIDDRPFHKDGTWRVVNLTPPVTDAEIIEALNAVQPYRRQDTTDIAPDDPTHSLLWALKGLSNIDKHRTLLGAVSVLSIRDLWWGSNEGDPSPRLRLNRSPLSDGDPVAWFDFGGHEPPAHFQPNLALQVRLNEPTVPSAQRNDVASLLGMLRQHVRWHVLEYSFRSVSHRMVSAANAATSRLIVPGVAMYQPPPYTAEG